jgi:hypothetical protein
MAALRLGIPEWNHAHLLQLAPPSLENTDNSSGARSNGSSRSEQTLASLLRAYPQDDIQLGDQVASTNMGAVLRGTIRGQPAVIKLLDLASVEAALEAAAEVRSYQDATAVAWHQQQAMFV